MTILEARSNKIKDLAQNLGFSSCGISKAQKLHEEEKHLESWLANNYHGKMQWMENHFDKRLDPSLLVPGSKSVVSLLFNYYPEHDLSEAKVKSSKYAYGDDYHHVVKYKLKELMKQIHEEYGHVEGRVFVDSAPIMERAWAAKSGLGWIGKHSLLLSKQKGSFFFLAELIIDLELAEDRATTDHCGSCTACIDACPTDAIISDQIIDSNKCISYLTIELKEEIPSGFQNQMQGWVFGCDICQDVCPWNKFSVPHKTKEFEPRSELMDLHKNEWRELTEEIFKDLFKRSAVKRAGYLKLKKSIEYCKADAGNS
ncbi:MAG: tRNA epoxyqueuosine(34) reductase QueG [Bacteroidia bacterium]